jgi:hypothetical protein
MFVLSNVSVYVVPYVDCIRLVWVDRGHGQVQGVVVSQGAIDEALRALVRWSNYLEPSWRDRPD